MSSTRLRQRQFDSTTGHLFYRHRRGIKVEDKSRKIAQAFVIFRLHTHDCINIPNISGGCCSCIWRPPCAKARPLIIQSSIQLKHIGTNGVIIMLVGAQLYRLGVLTKNTYFRRLRLSEMRPWSWQHWEPSPSALTAQSPEVPWPRTVSWLQHS